MIRRQCARHPRGSVWEGASGCLRAAVLLVLWGTAFVAPSWARERLDLDGTWQFATDPAEQGEKERWFDLSVPLPAMPLPGYSPAADGSIRVPGIWDNQGYGTETPQVRHSFIGKGWYRRQALVPPTWAGSAVVLAVTGVSRYAKVWVNGHLAGEHIGYVSAAEFDISPWVVPGAAAAITIQVDSKQRWEIDALYGASALADYMDIPWGGIWGHVFLESRPTTWLGEVYIQPDVETMTCSVGVSALGAQDGYDRVRLTVIGADGNTMGTQTVPRPLQSTAAARLELRVSLPEAETWTPDHPTLHTVRLELELNGQTIDVLEEHFGMRQFTTDAYRLLLNGKAIMLRGYGDDHIYPEHMAMPADKALHLNRLRLIKSYGFNHVRHHSTIMPQEYYEACDEVGIITTAEFPIVYAPFLPGTGATWRSHVPAGTDPGPALETYRREWTAAITQLRNHPSILCWVMGNELYDEMPLRAVFGDIARSLDPSRFFLDSDGASPALFDPRQDRETLDLYMVQFNEGSNPLDNPGKFDTPALKKPTLSHEAGNYVTFSRPDLVERFSANIKPFWMTAGRDKLAQLGLMGEAENWAVASERLYLRCHKANIEALRANPYLSGYHWWLFQDYWTSSNGIVDHTFRPKSMAPEEILAINSDVILLQKGLALTYASGAQLTVGLSVSNFSPDSLSSPLHWQVQAGNETLADGEVQTVDVAQGHIGPGRDIVLSLPVVVSPARLSLRVDLPAGQRTYRNEWSAWILPAPAAPEHPDIPVYADADQAADGLDWPLLPLPAEGELPAKAVYLVTWLEPRVVDAMLRGASVVHLGGGPQRLPTWGITFRTTWWKAGDSLSRNHCGTLVYDHPITRDLAPDGWCDAGWFKLLEGAAKTSLEGAPTRPHVIIRALPSLAAVQDEALLYDVAVGKGTLMVSGLNHAKAADQPENRWLIARMINHAARFEPPHEAWPPSFLATTEAAPEGCLPGFRRVVANEGEDDSWYSYREDRARVFICRQTEPGRRVTWETAVVPTDYPGDRITFAFAGGLGYASEPPTAGLRLEIEGRDVLAFDLPEPTQWASDDGRITLHFEIRRTIGPDAFGVFRLTVPRDLVTPGKSCRLGVRSVGQGSRRWFGLYPYTDTR